jgi:hypothetical protein
VVPAATALVEVVVFVVVEVGVGVEVVEGLSDEIV